MAHLFLGKLLVSPVADYLHLTAKVPEIRRQLVSGSKC